MNSPDDRPKEAKTEVEIRQDGSTIERFELMVRRLLGVSKSEVKEQEELWKKGSAKASPGSDRKAR